MSKGKLWRLGGFAAALAASAGLIAAASGATGAYFSDTKGGTIDGTTGAVTVTTSGGSNSSGNGTAAHPLNFEFTNLMPGTAQKATITYTNKGTGAEDIWLVFPNAQALHALNNFGRYASVSITTANQSGTSGSGFASSNLADGLQAGTTLPAINSGFGHCSALGAVPGQVYGSLSALSTSNDGGCYPLPSMIKLVSGLSNTSGTSGTMTFSFALGTKWTAQSLPHFLCYPLVQDGSYETSPAQYSSTGTTPTLNQANQVCTSDTTLQKFGLPYEIVATQPGVAPGQTS